jgi:DNA-binding GntR family transcriptional regulator
VVWSGSRCRWRRGNQRRLYGGFEADLEAADVESALRSDDEFHEVFVAAAGNEVLRKFSSR